MQPINISHIIYYFLNQCAEVLNKSAKEVLTASKFQSHQVQVYKCKF